MALAIPASASAATYCVYTGANTCPAGPTAIAGLQQGLDAAAGTPERDTVMVRPGTYDAGGSNGFTYNSASPVDLVGAGAVGPASTSTVIDDSSAVDLQWTLQVIGNTGSTVSRVRVDTVLADFVTGLDTSAAVDAVAVTTPAGFGGVQTGVSLRDGASLRRSDVEGEGPGGNAVGVGGSVTIEDSNLVSNRIGV